VFEPALDNLEFREMASAGTRPNMKTAGTSLIRIWDSSGMAELPGVRCDYAFSTRLVGLLLNFLRTKGRDLSGAI